MNFIMPSPLPLQNLPLLFHQLPDALRAQAHQLLLLREGKAPALAGALELNEFSFFRS